MSRREFTKAVYAQIVKRAMLESGEIACEGCGLILGKKRYQVDHTIADALQVDKSRKLTVDDGKLLGLECCHKPKTKQDVKVIAKAKRVEANYLRTNAQSRPIQSPGFPKSEKTAHRSTKAQLPPRQLYQAVDSHPHASTETCRRIER
ncbi:hypothetical protein [Rhizobium sp. Root1220]|uniref:hypothetical protein n=1 Tax=Rhizobium sp. Root1220 TaxID=1736432 RepID=UPI0006F6902A|nr:hypothetical protein [Rhizobium sp. Root1220]KQV83282.1 hypothetical protein ASC90_22085 [Rhizobium sp. Root1220]